MRGGGAHRKTQAVVPMADFTSQQCPVCRVFIGPAAFHNGDTGLAARYVFCIATPTGFFHGVLGIPGKQTLHIRHGGGGEGILSIAGYSIPCE